MKPGDIPELNLPTKGFPSIPFQPRVSASITKRKCLELSSQSSPTLSSSVYKSFGEFKDRICLLKLPTSWSIAISDNKVVFTSKDNIHMVPDFEIYGNEDLTFCVRVYLWKLPINHEIYTSNHHSLKNITLSNLVHVLHSYELCVGIMKDTSSSGYIEHVIPKIFLPSEETTFPLSQTKYFRSSACQMLITAKSICSMCDTLEKKERK